MDSGPKGARGVVVDAAAITTPLDPYLSLHALAAYSGLSVRKLRALLVEPARPLPCFRVGSKLLVRRSDFDTWIAAYRCVGRQHLDQLVADVVAELKSR